jgi:hypothetical protein
MGSQSPKDTIRKTRLPSRFRSDARRLSHTPSPCECKRDRGYWHAFVGVAAIEILTLAGATGFF